MTDAERHESYREEIEAALKVDTSRIGDVFRLQQSDEDKSAQSIADDLGLGTSNSVYSYRSSIRTLLEGRRVVSGTHYPLQIARMLRGFVGKHTDSLTAVTTQKLLALAEEHDRFASDVDTIARENEENERALESDDRLNVPGIYVYTYPHYYNSPVRRSQEDYTDNRTFLKVGVTEAAEGVSKRIQQQIGQVRTAIPEPPLILRIYNGAGVDLKEAEEKIQNHLESADHSRINRQRGSGVGVEWFLTHLKFLDSTASLLGLEVKYRHQDEDEE